MYPSDLLAQYGAVLVLGLGETGLAAAHWFLCQGHPLKLADTRGVYKTQVEQLQAHYAPLSITACLGPEALETTVLQGIQTVVISPGLAPTQPQVAALLAAAKQKNITVLSEIELFAQALQELAKNHYQPKVLAVTGTNGKTTVVQMLKYMLQQAGLQVVAAGNISPAALSALHEALEQNALPDVWLIELSSFQLEHTYSLPVWAGAVLNMSQDHLDWHGNLQAYTQAKAKLYAFSHIAVVNNDDATVQAMVNPPAQIRYFGLSEPTQLHELGLSLHHEQKWLSCMGSTGLQYLLPANSLKVVGQHNLSNALAALCLASTLIEPAPLLSALRAYEGEPHRCQFVRIVQGRRFINDSKGTNVGATVAAIQGLACPLVLIAGGVAKGQDFSPLVHAVEHSACRAVVLLGADAPFIAQAMQSLSIPIEQVQTMSQAVQAAYNYALEGDAVVLSPACASLDMYANYMQRGLDFIDAVTELALDHGEIA